MIVDFIRHKSKTRLSRERELPHSNNPVSTEARNIAFTTQHQPRMSGLGAGAREQKSYSGGGGGSFRFGWIGLEMWLRRQSPGDNQIALE